MSVTSVEAGLGTHHAKYERLIAAAKHVPSAVTVVVHPCDETSLTAHTKPPNSGL